MCFTPHTLPPLSRRGLEMPKNKFSFKVGAPLPKSLGQCADFYHEVQELRHAMAKEEISNHIVESLPVGDSGAIGHKYKAVVTSTEKATADDWEAIYDYVHQFDRYDLLGKSLNAKAVKEMWDNGEKVPGVQKFHAKKLSITKI